MSPSAGETELTHWLQLHTLERAAADEMGLPTDSCCCSSDISCIGESSDSP
jgi:hypothetical protein